MRTINTALIGFGASGRVFHAPLIKAVPGLRLAKVYTNNPDSMRCIEAQYPEACVVRDVGDIMRDESIELVVVASPNTSHFTIAKEAIISEKHVVLEKPFTVNTKEADNLIALSAKYGRLLTVYHNKRLESDFKTVRKVIESKLLGNLVECEIHFDRFRNYLRENAWREDAIPGSGIFYDLGSHLVDQAVVLFGLPDSLYADIRIQRTGGKADDNFEVTMNYKGLKVTLKAGMLVKGELPRYILLGDKGSFIKHGADVQAAELAKGCRPEADKDWGIEPEELYGTLNTTYNGLNIVGRIESERGDYSEFYKEVYRSVTDMEKPPVDPIDARNVIRLLELACESSKNRCVIDIKHEAGLVV